MIVFDLICRDGNHKFEGWFGSSADYEKQREVGLLQCPACGSAKVIKDIMAPNVGAKSNQIVSKPAGNPTKTTDNQDAQNLLVKASEGASLSTDMVQRKDKQDTVVPVQNIPEITPEIQEIVTKLADAQAKMLEKSEWVGGNFAENARAIHYGEEDQKMIHGETSSEEAKALEEEGIGIAPLPLPFVPPKAQN